ncbi:MAG: endosialidase [Butyrivibrio sp.]|nr:endosialidase [Butyrivibrio sp.]
MAVIEELLRAEKDGTVSFGNYELPQKAKKENFAHEGDILKVKTFKDITKLECNDLFLYESVPGTTVTHYKEAEQGVSFEVEGAEDAQITLGMEENTAYNVVVNGKSMGQMTTGVGGKLSFSVELQPGTPATVRVER